MNEKGIVATVALPQACPDGFEYRHILCENWELNEGDENNIKIGEYHLAKDAKKGNEVIAIKEENIVGFLAYLEFHNKEICYKVETKISKEKAINKKREYLDSLSKEDLIDKLLLRVDF